MAVATYSRLHDTVESGPMPRPEIVRDDQVERASDGFISRDSENPHRTRGSKN
jgi:hypothetical protein